MYNSSKIITDFAKVDMKENIIEFLEKVDLLFPIPLSEKVNIKEYVEKVLDNGKIIVSMCEDNIVGINLFYANDIITRQAWISTIAVDENFKSKGIGTTLISKMKEYCIKNKMKEIILYTHNKNERAIKLYNKNGFKICKEKQANHKDSITMICSLDNVNILLTSVGRRSYLVEYFKEALEGKGNIHVINNTDITPAFKCSDYSSICPSIYEKGYIEFLKEYCIENKISAIISLFDIDLPILSKNKQVFEKIGTKVIVSDKSIIDVCNDKWLTYKYLTDNNFNTPKTYISLDDALKDIDLGLISYPLIIKPRWGMGSISVYEVDNEDELRILYNKSIKNIMNTYLKYESREQLEQSVIIQEKLSGQEYGLDIINDLKGNYQNTIVKKKHAMRSGETDCAKTVNNKQLKLLGEKLSKKLHHIANLDTDIFLVGEKPYILEMNARFGGGYPFSHLAGVNLPKAIISWIEDKECNKELLIENYDIVGHKDINMVEINVAI